MGSVGRWIDDRRFDLVAAGAGLLLATLLFPLRFFASQIYILTIPLVLGGACLIYLLAAYWGSGYGEFPTLSTPAARSLPGLVLIGVAAMVFVAVHAEARPPLFHAIAAVVGSALLVQVVLSPRSDLRVGLMLAEVVLFALVLRFAALYTTPGFIGIDVWTHVNFTREIIAAESLSAIADDKYYASPLYHLYLASASEFLGLSLREALFSSIGLVMALSLLLVYALANLLVGPRWAALATLLYSVGDYVIQWGIHLIPTSLGLALYLAMLYGLVRVTRNRYNATDYGLILFVSIAIVLTHQVSSFIMVVTLAGALVTQVVMYSGLLDPPTSTRLLSYESRDPTTLAGVFVFNLGFITFMWSLTPYEGDTFLETVLSYLRQTLVSSAGFLNLAGGGSSPAGGVAAAPTLIETLVKYVDAGGYLLLMFATFLGSLYVVNRRHAEQPVVTLLVATAAMMVFVMGLPVFGIHNFIPTRWFAFLYVPMAVLGAIGIRYVAGELDPRVSVALILLFAATYPGAMLLSSDATIDNPVFEDQRPELAYTRAELDASLAIGNMTGSPAPDDIRPDQVAYTDHPYQTVIERRRSHPTDAIELNGSGPADHDITVYRRAQTTEATYFSVNGTARILNVDRGRVCRPAQNVLYSNGDVAFCTAPG